MPLFRGIGKQLQVGIAKESTRGTANTTGTVYWLAVSDWNVDERYEQVDDAETYGVIADAVSATRTKNWAEGQIVAPVADKSFPLVLLSLMGTSSPLQRPSDTTVYDHRVTVAETVQHQSLTVLIHDPIVAPSSSNADYSHANAVVTKLDLEYQLGSFIRYTAAVKALKGVMPSTGAFSPSQTPENRFVPQYASFKVATTPALANSTTAIALRSIKLSIDQNTEDDDVLGSTSPRDFLNKEFKVEGELEAIWKYENEFKTVALAGSTQAMVIAVTNSDTTIGTAGNPAVTISLPKVVYTEISRPVRIKELMYQNLKFKAYYSTLDGYQIRATCTNVVASY